MANRRLKYFERALWGWVSACHNRPRFVIATVLALAAASLAYAATHLGINTDTRDMIDPDLPYRQADADFQNAFPQLKNAILVVARGDTFDEVDAFSDEFVAAIAEAPGVEAVFAPSVDPFFVKNGLLFLEIDELERLLSRLTKAAPLLVDLRDDPTVETLFGAVADNVELAEESGVEDDMLDRVYNHFAEVIEARLAGAPQAFSWQALLSEDLAEEDAPTRLITVTPALDFSSLQPARAAIASIREAAAALVADGRHSVEIGVTGDPALRAEELQSVTQGIGLSFVVSLVIVGLLLYTALRSARLAAVSVGLILLSVSLTLGFAAVAVGDLNLVSIAFVVLLVGLGIDFVIHFAMHAVHLAKGGIAMRRGLIQTVNDVGGPLALAALTTMIAFFAFIPTKFVGMAQLGVISGVGVLISFIVSVTVLPAVFALIRFKKKYDFRKGVGAGRPLLGLRRMLALAAIAAGLAGVILLPQVRFDADPMGLRNPNSPSVVAFMSLFDDPDTAPYRLSVLAEDLEAAEALVPSFEALELVDRVITLGDFVPKGQDTKLELIDFTASSLLFDLARPPAPRAEDPPDGLAALRARVAGDSAGSSGARLRAALDAVANGDRDALMAGLQRDFFQHWDFQFRRMTRQLEPDYVELSDVPDQIRERFVAPDGRARIEIAPAEDLRDVRARRNFVRSVEEIHPNPAGAARTVMRAGEVVAQSMLQAGALALALVSVLLLTVLRSVSLAIIILFPLALAGILTSATGVLLDMPYNYANVIVLPLLIGLGVDSGIHLALRRVRPNGDQAADVFDTTTPRAVIFSAVTTIASFGSLALSEHRGTASMGALLTIAVSFTLLCTLAIVPVAADLLDRRRARSAKRAS